MTTKSIRDGSALPDSEGVATAPSNEKAPAFTPGPWRVGYWGGICRIPSHVAVGRHPGPPDCVYDMTFTEGSERYVGGIASNDPEVDVVWTEYDSLKIRFEDARLIAAAPDLYAALKALVYDDDSPSAWDTAIAVLKKAEGRQ